MEEGLQNMEIDDGENATVTTKKRARAPKKPKIPAALGVGIIGNRFVCSYSGKLCTHAIFVPGVADACFANLPCAKTWIERNTDAVQAQQLITTLCNEYEQTVEQVPSAPPREQLVDFGGNLAYGEWFAGLQSWDAQVLLAGRTVEDYQQNGSGTKRTKSGRSRISFEPGMYVVLAKRSPAAVKAVNVLEKEAKPGVKGQLTPSAAIRKLNNFMHKEEIDGAAIKVSRGGDGFVAFMLVPDEGRTIDEKHLNPVATALSEVNAYGPAVFIFTRKAGVSLQ